MSKKLMYPIFLQCREYCEDTFWTSIFDRLAYGIPPHYSISFDHDKKELFSTHKNKRFNYSFRTCKNPYDLFHSLKDILTNISGILSKKDKLLILYDDADADKILFSSWSEIKKKHIKEYLLYKYVKKIKKKYKLTLEQMKQLWLLLNMEIYLDRIVSFDIVLSNDEEETSIEDIIPLVIKNEGGEYSFKIEE